MIISIGIDIVDSRRIEKLMEKFSEAFCKKYFTRAENDLAQSKKSKKAQLLFYAKRFAAKEACAKALGTGFRDDVTMKNIEILNGDAGEPILTLYGQTRDFLLTLIPDGRVPNIHVSISDEPPYAIAQVLIEAR